MSGREGRQAWFSVRCLCQLRIDGTTGYEERITLWRAGTAEEAIRRAEEEAEQYAETVGVAYLHFAQAYEISDDVAEGAEVYSLIRRSGLPPDDYLSAFFDTGEEFQEHQGHDERGTPG
jgi:hypothetical protein